MNLYVVFRQTTDDGQQCAQYNDGAADTAGGAYFIPAPFQYGCEQRGEYGESDDAPCCKHLEKNIMRVHGRVEVFISPSRINRLMSGSKSP